MATANCTDQDVYPLAVTDGRFYVTATALIESPRGVRIEAGDHLLIDPQTTPKAGDLVLTGRYLEPWRGQASISGVAIQHSRFFR